MNERKRVLLAHYRVGMTDGVSLEIEKRRHILEERGFLTATLAGPGSRGADYIVEALDFEAPQARRIADNAFGEIRDYDSPSELMADISRLAEKIERELEAVFDDFKPDFLLIHNIFSHGRHIASASAFHRVLKRRSIRVLATHHDFYWERTQFRTPSCPAVAEYLEVNVPPSLPGLKHAAINSLAAAELRKRTGIEAMIFPDTLDFEAQPWTVDEWNSQLPLDAGFDSNDILVLQATRIVPRKAVELVIPILSRLNEEDMLQRIRGRTLYNGKTVSDTAYFRLIIAGYAEDEAQKYLESLEERLQSEGVPYNVIADYIAAGRIEDKERRHYALFDTYPWADIVSYPSMYEGWGNQFLETLFAKKPAMVYEYPVFRSDIRDRGYFYISLGQEALSIDNDGLYRLSDTVIDRVAGEVIEVLTDKATVGKLENNFSIGKTHNSYKVLEQLITEGLEFNENSSR